jgi:hypothetical protein
MRMLDLGEHRLSERLENTSNVTHEAFSRTQFGGMKETLEVLNAMVGDGVIENYAIGGAVAAIFYTEPTDTVDLDVVVAFARDRLVVTLEPITAYLASRGYADFFGEGIVIEGIPVQFLPTGSPLSEEAFREAREVVLFGVPARVLRLEHLMATMLEVGRAKDYLRLAMCVEQTEYDEAAFLDIIARHGLSGKWEQFQQK